MGGGLLIRIVAFSENCGSSVKLVGVMYLNTIFFINLMLVSMVRTALESPEFDFLLSVETP